MVSELLLRGLRQFLGFDDDDSSEEDVKEFNADGSEALIGEVIYDPDNQQLSVTYSNGRSYSYFGVSRQRFEAFKRSGSRGQYINYSIKPNYFYSEE